MSSTEQFIANTTWTVPSGVTRVLVECWGAGQVGFTAYDAEGTVPGGHGGAYASSLVTVTPGSSIALVVAQASSAINTSFNTSTVVAQSGVNGGLASGSTGTTKYNGGVAGGYGYGGGGGGAGNAGNGSGTATSATGSAGGAGTVPGGAGGNPGAPGVAGSAPGGGGGGGSTANATPKAGGAGARGYIILTYTVNSSNFFQFFR